MSPRRAIGIALRSVVRVVIRPPAVRRIVEATLRETAPKEPGQAVAPPPVVGIPASFTDRHGVTHALDGAIRDRLKPGWRSMCERESTATRPTDAALRERARKVTITVAEARALVASVAGGDLRGRILEVGCYDGAVAFALARDPAVEVVASDLARYYAVQRPDEPTSAAVEREQAALDELRSRAAAVAAVDRSRVAFVEDDITTSTLEPASFDAIVSFEVLEHLADPPAAFAAMAALLRSGGLLYHDYNPFFAVNGGHALATLDLPWGHVRFDETDVERYLREIRPKEADQALRFYRENLNRMTQSDLRAAIDAAGLELLALLPWTQRSLTPTLDPGLLGDVRRNYPSATIDDLLGTFVSVVARKPG